MAARREKTSAPGVYRNLSNGTFEWQILQRDHDGKRVPVRGTGYRTLPEAREAKVAATSRRDAYPGVVPRKLTLERFIIDTWLPDRQRLVDVRQLELSTLERNRRDVVNRIIPYVGHIQLQRLKSSDIERLRTTLLASGRREGLPEVVSRPKRHHPDVYTTIITLKQQALTNTQIAQLIAVSIDGEEGITRHQVGAIWRRSQETYGRPSSGRRELPGLSVTSVQAVHVLINQILDAAVREQLIISNVGKLVAPLRKDRVKRRRKQWNPNETARFLAWMWQHHPRDFFLILFIANSADRRGANLALRWSDIDWVLDEITMRWTLTRPSNQVKKLVKPYGKTDEFHIIALDPYTKGALLQWRKMQAAERSKFDELVHVCSDIPGAGKGELEFDPAAGGQPTCTQRGYHDRDLVFCTPVGDYYQPNSVTDTFLYRQDQYNRAHPDSPLPRVDLHALRGGWTTTADYLSIGRETRQARLHHQTPEQTDHYTLSHRPTEDHRVAAVRVAEQYLTDDLRRVLASAGGLMSQETVVTKTSSAKETTMREATQ